MQLLRLKPAFSDCDVVFATVNQSFGIEVQGHPFYTISDGTRFDRLRLIRCLLKLVWIVVKERPDVVVSTGAAPGYLAIRVGKLFRARTVWLDSIANIEHMSLAGSMVERYADLWLTQWPHLSRSEGPRFRGAIL